LRICLRPAGPEKNCSLWGPKLRGGVICRRAAYEPRMTACRI
jgi:hypothetical protein